MNYTIITILETIYLVYMFFIFKTKFNIGTSILDKTINNLGSFFVHNTTCYGNKICGFGKLMAIVSIILGFVRLKYLDNPKIFIYILVFDLSCLLIAFLMNMNAFIYLMPLVITELIIIKNLYINTKLISSYRLGDLVLLSNISENEQNEILTTHPNSIW